MAATERVVVLTSPAEKAALDAKAASAGRISAGELIRRAVDACDAPNLREAAELRARLDVVAVTHEETLRQLDRAERKLDASLTQVERKKP